MLRALVVTLLVANLAFYAWSQGWLDSVVGDRSTGDREPERLARQVRPEQVHILPAGAASAAASAPAASTALACLEAGPFSDSELASARTAAQAALPGANIRAVKTEVPGVWMVYMGRYVSRELLTKKVEELKRRKLQYEEVRAPAALAPGLSLGRFSDPGAATVALDQFAQQGIRTARVVEFAPATGSNALRIDSADAALVTQATATISPAALGKSFAPCVKP
ncbi:MAG: hypothetical protein ABI702_05715 [Burkholderiales bacterium]